jgi:hypothetical protein
MEELRLVGGSFSSLLVKVALSLAFVRLATEEGSCWAEKRWIDVRRRWMTS